MADLESALLGALLGFVRDRIEKLVATVAPTPETLLSSLLGYAATPSQLAQLAPKTADVQTNLTQAAAHASAFVSQVAAPPASVAAAQGAVSELAATLSQLDAAAGLVASVVPDVGPMAPALRNAIADASKQVGESLGGVPGQLGLLPAAAKLSDGLVLTGTRIGYNVANAARRDLAGAGGASLALRQSNLRGWLDYGAKPQLGATIGAGISAGLALDGFLAQFTHGGAADLDADVLVSLDSDNGVTFGAGVRQRISLPGQLTAPGLTLRDLGLELPDPSALPGGGADPAGPGFNLTATLAGDLAAIAATVEGAGVHVGVDPAKLGANQSPIAIAPQSPVGAGIQLSAGPIAGGGYLYHQGDQYGGALDLRMGPIQIKAVGLVDTSPFSLVLVLGVEFTPAIQLSFGFTLNGVGGLLALERRLDPGVLANDLSSGAADAILFPATPWRAPPRSCRRSATCSRPRAAGSSPAPCSSSAGACRSRS